MASGFEEFVASTSPRLERTARMLLGSAAESQDLTQETLIAMYRHWDRLRDPEAAEAYAYTTLIRLVRRHLRRARFRHEISRADTRDDDRPALDVVPVLRDDSVVDALTLLPARQREAVVLRYYLDLSIEATARAMRCSTGTVKSQVSKALATMRHRLENPEPSRVGEQ